jgi:hypothetical protein
MKVCILLLNCSHLSLLCYVLVKYVNQSLTITLATSGIFIICNSERAHELKEITKFLNVAVCKGRTDHC